MGSGNVYHSQSIASMNESKGNWMTEEKIRDFYKSLAEIKRTSIIKECFHPNKNECKGDIKQSHSIQRNGRLSVIESEVNGNNSVYTFTSVIPSDNSPIGDLKPIGKGEASTFFGFCDYHDTTLFSPIENFPFDINNDKHCFLHSYRSFAHSYHRKYEELKTVTCDNILTRNTPKSDLLLQKKGIEIGIKQMEERKKYLDKSLEKEQFDNLDYLTYTKEGIYPFAVSSMMSPKVSYNNKPMNNHIDFNVLYSHPMITFLPDTTSTIVIIAAFPDDKKSVNLLDELELLDDLKLEKAITSLIIANCENTFFSPKFWNYLSPKEKRILLDEFVSNTNELKYNDLFFISEFNFFDSKYEMTNLNNHLGKM
jgi:hypothetical protein